MTELEAYNQILALLGLPPIHSTAVQNKVVAIIGDSLTRARKRVLRRAWVAFARRTTLAPDGNSQIDVSSYLRVVYPKALRSRLTERNGKVWDQQADGYYGSTIQNVYAVEDAAFSLIDFESWQEYIALEAAVEAYQRINDADTNLASIIQQRNQARRQAYNEKRVSIDGAFGVDEALRGFYD